MIIGFAKNVFMKNLTFSQKTFPGFTKKIIRVLVMKMALQINTYLYKPLLYEFIY